MDTNSPQFQKAYSDLIAAFLNFMNVVNPGSASQATMQFISTQLATIVKCLGAQVQGSPSAVGDTAAQQTSTVTGAQPADSGFNVPVKHQTPDAYTAPIAVESTVASNTPVVGQATVQSQPTPITGDVTILYSSYPELVKNEYKFKSSSIRTLEEGKSENSLGEDIIYKLTIAPDGENGTAELMPISMNTGKNRFEIVTHNPGTYLPPALCDGSANVSENINSLSSDSVVRIKKVSRGWTVVEGDRFKLKID